VNAYVTYLSWLKRDTTILSRRPTRDPGSSLKPDWVSAQGIAAAVAKPEDGVGQLIFDSNGEYANNYSVGVALDIRTAHGYRCTRAVPPLANASTSSTRAIVTSPWKVVSSAPCAHPRRSASSAGRPVSRP
jgi:hypothetical protein